MARIGDIIGGWKLQGKIGSGGQGQVFVASHGEGEKEAAIKLVHCKWPKKKARFIQEVSVHVALADRGLSNIIPVLGHNLDELRGGENTGYIVMPIATTNLEDKIELLIGRTELCIEIFRGVVTGISHAHAAGVIHRDIKPSNVLFLDKALREPQISDFGICFLRETPNGRRLTDVGETVGARYFMAPEQERGEIIDVSPAADIYALGKLLYYMLTGKYLYREELEEAFTNEELQADPRLLIILDRILKATIMEAPTDRLQSTQELLDRLNEVLPAKDNGIRASHSIKNKSLLPKKSNNSRPDSELSSYQEYISLITSDSKQKIKFEFEPLRDKFRSTWQTIYDEIRNSPLESPEASQRLIQEQTQATALVLAIAKCDSKELFRPAKQFIEFLTKPSEEAAGYVAVLNVPYVQAGFLYMAMSIIALEEESWDILNLLLTEKFEWYYQSGRPLYCYGFDHPYFFNNYVFDRSAIKTHDFYRKLLEEDAVIKRNLSLKGDDLLKVYVQVQFLMSLRGSQYIEQGEDIFIWPDFGRFYGYRLEPLLGRIYNDDHYSKGVLSSFNEPKEQFFERLNNRLSLLSSRFRNTNYFWESIHSWEPRNEF